MEPRNQAPYYSPSAASWWSKPRKQLVGRLPASASSLRFDLRCGFSPSSPWFDVRFSRRHHADDSIDPGGRHLRHFSRRKRRHDPVYSHGLIGEERASRLVRERPQRFSKVA